MNLTADVQTDFSILLSCIVEYLYENETISSAGNSISVIIFLQGRNFCFHPSYLGLVLHFWSVMFVNYLQMCNSVFNLNHNETRKPNKMHKISN